ncbi:MAG: T9SS type A sorting domain-containing protein [Cytophagales bacterium]|nr:T9SS type A sorting domain-containing protein [Cytophagales bacterium]
MYGGQYAITSTPSNRDASPFVFLDKLDKTGDATRNMMLINANKGNGAIIYSTTISGIQSGTEYGFSMWLANVNQVFTNSTPDTSNTYPNPKTANVEILVNGTSLGRIKQPLDTVWRQYGGLWTAPSSANAVIQIVNRETLGNDISGFVIDDLKFSTTYSITKTATVTSPICALPVNYVSFEVLNKKHVAELAWQTTSEKNNSHFVVERSSNGMEFIPLGKINATHDVYARVAEYNFIDNSPLYGTSYYRLKQVDLDGKSTYTPVRTIHREPSLLVSIYPNPSENGFHISVITGGSNPVSCILRDLSGKTISSFQVSSTDVQSFGNELSPGIYILEVLDGNHVETLKLIKN